MDWVVVVEALREEAHMYQRNGDFEVAKILLSLAKALVQGIAAFRKVSLPE